jgi:hypothetical protein
MSVAAVWSAATVKKHGSWTVNKSTQNLTKTSLASIRRTTMAKSGIDRFVHGTRPVHTHIDNDGERWNCNSPYCIDMQTDPPDKGGPPIILEGLEPWRGRQ